MEIKFKVWHKKKKKMFQVETFSLIHECVNCCELTDNPPFCRWTFTFKDVEILRYTGFKDKNNKEIYEGDILRNKINSWSKGNKYKTIKYTKNKNYTGFNISSRYNNKRWEIIGNIYENPKLLDAI